MEGGNNFTSEVVAQLSVWDVEQVVAQLARTHPMRGCTAFRMGRRKVAAQLERLY